MWPVSQRNPKACASEPFDLRTAQIFVALVALTIAYLFPDIAYAQPSNADTFGRMLCNAKDSLQPAAPLLSAIAYIAGGITTMRGGYLFKKHADAPQQQTISGPVWHVLAGAAMAGLPPFIGTLQTTFGLNSSGGTTGCDPQAPGSAQALDTMMQNMVNNIAQPMTTLVSIIAITVGIVFVYKGLLASAKIGTDPRSSAPTTIIVNLVIGAVLVSIGSSLSMVMDTIFGTSSFTKMSEFSGIQWSKIDPNAANTAAADKTVKAILMFIQIIGMIAFVRGWLVLKKAAEGGQATVAQGITHLVGGAMAINIGGMLKIMDTTFGTGVIK